MGWLRKLFKGPSHKILERQFYDDVIRNEPSCSGVLVDHKNEDVDHAFALCVGDDDHKGKRVIDAKIQLEEDEQLARAIEESLIVVTQQDLNECENGNMHKPFWLPYSEGYRICAGCLAYIGQGGRFLNFLGAIWHPECFRCTGCKYQISDYEFSLSGSNPFHKSCYKEYHHPKCEVCGHFLSKGREKTLQIGGSTVGPMTEPHNLRRRCEVTAILVLYGLPRLLTGSILVHEMMHAWLRLKGYKTLNEQVEEGICQVMSHMWLSYRLDGAAVQGTTTLDSFERRIGELFLNQIESDLSPVYGEGFRAAKWAVFRYGLPTTLHHMWLTGLFPS